MATVSDSCNSEVNSYCEELEVQPDFMKIDCFADCIAKVSHSAYACLPKTGKPKAGQEWTLLSTVVQANNENLSGHDHPELKVVALGTGSKCIGQNKMSEDGDILNDSHAEVVARRAFLRYLYYQISLAEDLNSACIFVPSSTEGLYLLRPNISFHFYTSHTPCGDASIFPKEDEDDNAGLCINEITDKHHDPGASLTSNVEEKLNFTNKRPYCEDFSVSSKRQKSLSVDVHRTGAKCVPDEKKQDPKLSGLDYHVLGAVRLKPGRGDPTLSVSCSDKLMRWNCVGIQGALISRLLARPVYLQSVIVGGGCPFSESALERALISRVSHVLSSCLPKNYQVCRPCLRQACIPFPDRKTAITGHPSPTSLIWCAVPFRNFEVAVDGRKQGVTKKNLKTKSGRLMICKKELFYNFVEVFSSRMNKTESISDLPYYSVKEHAQSYSKAWQSVRSIANVSWTKKHKKFESFICETTQVM